MHIKEGQTQDRANQREVKRSGIQNVQKMDNQIHIRHIFLDIDYSSALLVGCPMPIYNHSLQNQQRLNFIFTGQEYSVSESKAHDAAQQE